MRVQLFYFFLQNHVRLVLHQLDTHFELSLLRLYPFIDCWEVDCDKGFGFRRLELLKFSELPLEFDSLLVFLEQLQALLAREGNRLVEEFVEIEVVFGEEVHSSCVEAKPRQIIIESHRKDIEVKGRGDDPSVN